MAKKAVIVAAAGALIVGAFYLRQRAGQAPADSGQGLDYIASGDYSTGAEYKLSNNAGALETVEDWIHQNIIESEFLDMQPEPIPQAGANVAAMLATIRESEGTADRADPYRVCFAYRHTIASFSDHPAKTGEWRGEPLSASLCAGAGLGPGCVSTAAGAYQIIRPTWDKLKSKLGLRDFSPASQDAAAIELLRQRGALGPLQRGDFAGAVKAARKEWASLPGAGYGQGERSMAWLTDKFTSAGGVLA